MKKISLSFLFFSLVVLADNYSYFQGPTMIESSSTTVTAAGTTTFSVSSNTNQEFTGSTTQTAKLPSALSLKNGRRFSITNRSTGLVTVQDFGSNTLRIVPADSQVQFLLISNGTANGTWDVGSVFSLNGLTTTAQTFATGTSGTDFAISSSSSTHTFNIPDASATARGLITTGTQTIAGSKTFSSTITGTTSGNTTYAANNHGVVLSSSTNAMSVLAPSSSTVFPLVSGGTGADPSWSLLTVPGGGTGAATLTANGVLYGNGTSAIGATSAGTSTTLLHGTNPPTFAAVSLTADVSGTLPLANGGTNATTKSSAFDSLSPMTTLGDTIYGGTSGTGTRLGGNTTTTRNFLRQTGTGVVSAAPAWDTLVSGDIPAANLAASGNGGVTGTLPIANGGTNAVTASAAFNNLSPMTTLGDIIYGGSSPAGTGTRLPGNTTTTMKFLAQTGNGTISAAPSWETVSGAGVGDVSSNTSTSVDSEMALFSGTGGKTIKRATGSGAVTATSGVYGTVAAGTTGNTFYDNGTSWVSVPNGKSYEITNLSCTVTASSGTITAAIKDAAGNNPSSSSPVRVGFRTNTTGFNQRFITSSLSGTLSGSNHLGMLTGTAQSIFVYLIDDGGTISVGFSPLGFDEGAQQTISTTGTSNQVIFDPNSHTGAKPIREVCRFLSTNTGGTSWGSPSDTSVLPFHPQQIFARYHITSNQSIGSSHDITWDVRDSDKFNMLSGGTGTASLTVPKTGIYRITESAFVFPTSDGTTSSGVGNRYLLTTNITGNDFLPAGKFFETNVNANAPGQAPYAILHGSSQFTMTAGDTIKLTASQNTNFGTVNVGGNADITYIEVIYLGELL